MFGCCCSCVVSAVSAVTYAQSLVPSLPLMPVTIALLFVFALLYIWGIKDSANVALGMYLLHTATLVLLLVASLVYVCAHAGGYFSVNFSAPLPDVSNLEGTANVYTGNVAAALFFGTSHCPDSRAKRRTRAGDTRSLLAVRIPLSSSRCCCCCCLCLCAVLTCSRRYERLSVVM